MALSKKALQKKREKKNKKRNQLKSSKSMLNASNISYKTWSVHECWVPKELWNLGIGNVIVALKSTVGEIAMGVYLVDVFCLGIKNCYVRHSSINDYNEFIKVIDLQQDGLELADATYVKTLIQQSIDYARQFGFQPHRDFNKAKKIIEYLQTDSALVPFVFGKDGKPFYVSGPNETKSDIRKIMGNLEKYAGDGNYDFLVASNQVPDLFAQ